MRHLVPSEPSKSTYDYSDEVDECYKCSYTHTHTHAQCLTPSTLHSPTASQAIDVVTPFVDKLIRGERVTLPVLAIPAD